MSNRHTVHTPTPSSSNTTTYYSGLDIAKAVFMMLGVIFHAAYPFRASAGWVVSYHESHMMYDALISFIKGFRMMGFYVLAGFFFALTIEKNALSQGFFRRFARLAIPLAVIGLGAHLWIVWLHGITLDARYVIHGEWLRQLWFIGNLIVYDAAAALLFLLSKERLSKALSSIAFMRHSTRVLLIVLLIGLPIAAYILRVMANNLILPVMQADHFLFITPYWLCVYAPYYAFGLFCYYQRHQIMPYLNWRSGLCFSLLYLIASFVEPFILSLATSDILPAMLGKPVEGIYPVMVKTLQMVASLCLLNALAAYAPAFRPFVKASYTVYLLHVLVLYTLYAILEPLALPAFAFFALLASLTFLSLYMLHHLLVTKSPLATLLINGAWRSTQNITHKQRAILSN